MEDPTLDLQSKRQHIVGQGLSNAAAAINLREARALEQAKQNSFFFVGNGKYMNGYGQVYKMEDLPANAITYDSQKDYLAAMGSKSSSSSQKTSKAIPIAKVRGDYDFDPQGNLIYVQPDNKYLIPCGPQGFDIEMEGGGIGKMKPVAIFDASGKDVTSEKPLSFNAVGSPIAGKVEMSDGIPVIKTDWESSTIPVSLRKKLKKAFDTDGGKYYDSQQNGILVKTGNGYYVIMDYVQ
jgi:hypothetical protein